MHDPNTAIEEFARFYKISRTGRLHKKSPRGLYVEMKNRAVPRRLYILTSKSLKRIE